MKVVNWNVQWATPRSERSPEILRRLAEHAPDIICLTETDADFGLGYGHTICALPDYGMGVRGKRRKVILWSRNPWRPASGLGRATLVPGRFVAGSTDTPVGALTVLGICIPWAGSRTARFGGKQRQWQDHEEYLDGLKKLLAPVASSRVSALGRLQPAPGREKQRPAPVANEASAGGATNDDRRNGRNRIRRTPNHRPHRHEPRSDRPVHRHDQQY